MSSQNLTILTAYIIIPKRRKQETPLISVMSSLRASGMIHCGSRFEFSRVLASSTDFSGSDLEVLPLPPPLVSDDVAYPHYSACLLS